MNVKILVQIRLAIGPHHFAAMLKDLFRGCAANLVTFVDPKVRLIEKILIKIVSVFGYRQTSIAKKYCHCHSGLLNLLPFNIVCKDLRSDCDRLAEADFCYKAENQMATLCPLSCGACLSGQWGEWENRSACNPDSGIQMQDRNCQGSACPGSSMREVECPVNGGWTDWVEKTACNMTSGTLIMTRDCSNPSPKNGGQPCEGESSKTEECAVDGSWSSWGDWGSCENGERVAKRICNLPSPLNGGEPCSGDETKKEGCGTVSLNLWNGWSVWSECRNGERIRRRTCRVTNCEGLSTERSRCHYAYDGMSTICQLRKFLGLEEKNLAFFQQTALISEQNKNAK